jgi:hypothetical protein
LTSPQNNRFTRFGVDHSVLLWASVVILKVSHPVIWININGKRMN